MTTGTKFWLSVGVVAACFLLAALYILKATTIDATVLGAILGVITLIVGGYFTTNAAITTAAIKSGATPPAVSTTTAVDPTKPSA